MTNINQNLMNFINQTPNAYFCAQNLRKKLIENGFVELYENQSWDNLTDNGKYFVVMYRAKIPNVAKIIYASLYLVSTFLIV